MPTPCYVGWKIAMPLPFEPDEDLGSARPREPAGHAARERQRQAIAAAVRQRIAAVYAIEDELQLLRTAPSPEFEVYNAYVEDCLAWGRAERARRGV